MKITKLSSKLSIAQQAATISLVATAVNVGVKLTCGLLSNSVSVLSEALQSMVDILVTLGIIYAIKVASKPPDEKHPYGHGKAEILISALQMVLILLTALFILLESYHRFLQPQEVTVSWGIFAMVYSMLTNLFVVIYLTAVYKKTKSLAIESEIFHLRSDVLASFGILLGLLALSYSGWKWLDPLIAILFIGVIVFGAARKLVQLMHPLMDGALPPQILKQLKSVLDSDPEVKGYHNVRSRSVGFTYFIELHLLLDDNLSFSEAHHIAENVEDKIREAIPGTVVFVHYEPYAEEIRHQVKYHHRFEERGLN